MDTGAWGFTLGQSAPVIVRMPRSILPFPLQRSYSLWCGRVSEYALAASQACANGVLISLPLSDLAGDDRLSLSQIASVGKLVRQTAEHMVPLKVWLFVEIVNTPMPAWLSSAGGIDGQEGRSHLANVMSAFADALGPAAGVGAIMPDVGLTQPPLGADNWNAFIAGGSAQRLWKQWRQSAKLSDDDTLPDVKWVSADIKYGVPQAKLYDVQKFRTWLYQRRWNDITSSAAPLNSSVKWGCHIPDGKLALQPGEMEKFGGILGIDIPAQSKLCTLTLDEFPSSANADPVDWTKRATLMLRASTKGTQPNIIAEISCKMTSDEVSAKLRNEVTQIRKHCAGLILCGIELASALGKDTVLSCTPQQKRTAPRSFVRLSRKDELVPVTPGRLLELLKASLVRVQQTDGQWDRP